jgi:hypothetical protein
VNDQIEDKFWSLGLARIVVSLPAEKCIELVQKVLTQFMMNYGEDSVCIATNGAAVMQKVGRLSNCDQKFCIVHGIQLGMQDVLYKNGSTSAKTILKGISNDENNSGSDDDNEEDTTTDDDANITNDEDEDLSDGFQVAMTEKDDTLEQTDDFSR